jgi:hypothetical protein
MNFLKRRLARDERRGDAIPESELSLDEVIRRAVQKYIVRKSYFAPEEIYPASMEEELTQTIAEHVREHNTRAILEERETMERMRAKYDYLYNIMLGVIAEHGGSLTVEIDDIADYATDEHYIVDASEERDDFVTLKIIRKE